MRDPLDVSDSIVASLRRGGRGEQADLTDAVAAVFAPRSAGGAAVVLGVVLRESVCRIDDARRGGAEVSADVAALLRGLPPDVLSGVRRPDAWGRLWTLLNDFALPRCRASGDPFARLLAQFADSTAPGRGIAPAPRLRKGFAEGHLPGQDPTADTVRNTRGLGRFRDPGFSPNARNA